MTKKSARAKAPKRGAPGRRGARPKRGLRAVIPAGSASLDAVYDVLARELRLPAHFGRNLDALYDALTGDVAGPITIVIEDATALERSLGEKGRMLIEALRDAAGARKDLRLELG